MTGTPRLGVVGAGYWGPNLIRNAFELGILDSVCDANPIALVDVKRKYPEVALVASYDALLQRPIDAVVIATPAQLHGTMALQALGRGKHVFVEKPLALTLGEAEEIVRQARERKLQAFVGHLLLYHPAVKKLRALIAEGAIGDVWHLRSRRLSLGKLRAHESVWWSFAPHDVAVMLAIMGEEPIGVSAAQSSQPARPNADVAYADYRFASGRTAHIEVCWFDPRKAARLDVFGTRGALTLEDSRAGSELTLTRYAVDHADPLKISREDGVAIPVSGGEPLAAELRAFAASITSSTPAETNAEQGLAVLRLLQMADEAAGVDSHAAMAV